jgi:hypothetical protein
VSTRLLIVPVLIATVVLCYIITATCKQAAYVKRGHKAAALESGNAVFTISYRTSRKGKAAAKGSAKGKGKAKGT